MSEKTKIYLTMEEKNEKEYKTFSLQTIDNISKTLQIDIKCFFENSDI